MSLLVKTLAGEVLRNIDPELAASLLLSKPPRVEAVEPACRATILSHKNAESNLRANHDPLVVLFLDCVQVLL